MAKNARDDGASVGRSIAVPLVVFGVIALVIGAARMASGAGDAFVIALAGVCFLVGAVLAGRLAR